MKNKRLMKTGVILAIACAALLAGCGPGPATHINAKKAVREKFPESEIEQIENYGKLLQGPSYWLVRNADGGLFVVWCNDRGQVSHEQEMFSR